MYKSNRFLIRELLLGIAVAISASPAQSAENYVLGVCSISRPGSGAEIVPTVTGDMYLYEYHGSDSRYQGFTFDDNKAKVTLVKNPIHGRVENENSTVSNSYYHYYSVEGYVGQDRFEMQVEKNGVKVRIQYLIEVPLEDEPTGHMCNPEHWKISAATPVQANAIL